MRSVIYRNNLKKKKNKKNLSVENRCLMNDKDTAAASLVGISEVACRKLNRLARGGAGPQPRGGGWRGARLIGFAPESDYTFPTAAPPFLFTCGLLNGGHTPWRAPVFTARLEAGGCRLEA